MNNKELSHGKKVREKILQAIIDYIQVHQYPPTIREIGRMVGLKSNSSVYTHLTKLRAEGKIESDTDFSAPRAIRVPGYTIVPNNMQWIDTEMEVPPDNNYILVSFKNWDVPSIGRYEEDEEGGAFYPGDEDRSYISFGIIVNAWMPLPGPYRPKEE